MQSRCVAANDVCGGSINGLTVNVPWTHKCDKCLECTSTHCQYGGRHGIDKVKQNTTVNERENWSHERSSHAMFNNDDDKTQTQTINTHHHIKPDNGMVTVLCPPEG